ncbi:MAG: hypothetical protein C5B49_04130 [Bdellovibrio sp.]|nr:MAG: hypothetical protein C5B49_04130 [Bdellovibrio sp.]
MDFMGFRLDSHFAAKSVPSAPSQCFCLDRQDHCVELLEVTAGTNGQNKRGRSFMKKIILTMGVVMVMSACQSKPIVVTAETEPPRWHPKVIVDSALVRDASDVKLIFKELDLSLDLRPSGSVWLLELNEPTLNKLLGGQDRQTHLVELKYRVRTPKGRIDLLTKEIQLVINRHDN